MVHIGKAAKLIVIERDVFNGDDVDTETIYLDVLIVWKRIDEIQHYDDGSGGSDGVSEITWGIKGIYDEFSNKIVPPVWLTEKLIEERVQEFIDNMDYNDYDYDNYE